MREYGIIGFPLTHSHSPVFFKNKFTAEGIKQTYYHAFPLERIIDLHHLIKHHPFLYGLNITSPYKEEILLHLHKIDELALTIGSVNVINIKHEKDTTELIGYNTDAPAFAQALKEKWAVDFRKALIFGTGGAAKAAAYVLQEQQIEYRFVSRSRAGDQIINYQALTPEIIDEYKLLINATPIGIYPDTGAMLPIPFDVIGSEHYLMDLIYNPEETLFLSEGKKRGAQIQNGERMFQLQAERSWQIWTGKSEEGILHEYDIFHNL